MAWCIKGANRSAVVAFAPDGAYLAAGTMAGAVDLQFSSSANLDVFELDFVSDDKQLILSGTAPSSERFNRISWGRGPAGSEEYSLGLIAGGLVDGNIGLWNPKSLICKKVVASENALVGNLTRNRGSVRGLEFNSLSPNLLASGADEGEICIWDLSKPSEPSHFPPLKGSGSATQGEISFLSWNSKVQHILASTSFNGTTAVWDLKKQKPVISFSDSLRRRCSVMQWNPDVATQLIVASDEDSSPTLRLWDMRNVMTPVKEFVGHSKGVIAMSWCPIDSTYLLSCAKDNRTICWDTLSGEIVAELPAGTNWNFDIHWYYRIPGVVSASSFDGKIGIYNIEGCGQYGAGEGDFVTAPVKAPKWYKNKAGVSFGFGGKLVSFQSIESSTRSSEVYVQNLVAEHSLASRSSEFEDAIQNGDRSALKSFCEKKSIESVSEEERETWGFMKVMFTEDGTARSKLLSHLGFSSPAVESNVSLNDISEEVNSLGLNESITDKEEFSGNRENSILAPENVEDFFDNLASPHTDTTSSTFRNETVIEDNLIESPQETAKQDDSQDPLFDDAVQHALVVGDYKGAAAQCISVERFADALIIAHVGGSSLWEQIRDQYLKINHSPYLKVVSALVNNDLMSITNTRPLKSWKETLALYCTFAQIDEWTVLCDELAAKLMASGDTVAATLCYICAGNIDKTVEIWSKNLTREHDQVPYVDRLQELMEKTIVFALATGQKRFSLSLCKLVEKYAEILASQGLLTTAMKYLNLLGTEQSSPELLILRDRIALSTEPENEKPLTYENTRSQTGIAFGADQSDYDGVISSQMYHQETAQSQVPQTAPGGPHGENYQQPPAMSFGRGYDAPSQYQPIPRPAMPRPAIFVPSEAPPPQPIPSQMGNFPQPPLTTQSPVNFIPSNPPLLKNVEQYQQPSSLGSHLYPGTGNPSYQAGPPGIAAYSTSMPQTGPSQGQKIPQVMAPTPPSRGFMPASNSGIQRPGIQPPSPSQLASVQPAVIHAAPPPTVQTVDTSNVPAHQKPIIATLTRLFNETSEALGGSRANPAKKREIEDNSKKFGALFLKLNSGDISKNAGEKLVLLCQALDKGDFGTGLQIQVQLTTSDWDECNFWLATLKRMIKTRQTLR